MTADFEREIYSLTGSTYYGLGIFSQKEMQLTTKVLLTVGIRIQISGFDGVYQVTEKLDNLYKLRKVE